MPLMGIILLFEATDYSLETIHMESDLRIRHNALL